MYVVNQLILVVVVVVVVVLWLLFGCVCLLGFVQERYKKPVISVCCWHVHCEECWLHTLVTCDVHTFTCLDM